MVIVNEDAQQVYKFYVLIAYSDIVQYRGKK